MERKSRGWQSLLRLLHLRVRSTEAVSTTKQHKTRQDQSMQGDSFGAKTKEAALSDAFEYLQCFTAVSKQHRWNETQIRKQNAR